MQRKLLKRLLQIRVKNDLPLAIKRFNYIANSAVKRMEELLANGQSKVTYQALDAVLNKFNY